MGRGRPLIAVAAALLSGCGSEAETRPGASVCAVSERAVVTGPFCVTRAGALREIERAVGPVRCERVDVAGASLPQPASLQRCRTRRVAFRLAVYDDANTALRARPTLLRRSGIERPSERVRLSHNLLVVLDRHSGAGARLLRVVGDLGDDAT